MKLKCLHGYFLFEETSAGQLSDFVSLTGFDLVPKGNKYTFADLEEAPEYSITAKPFLDFPAIATYEGEPWEVFEANGVVYNFALGLVVPIQSVIQRANVELAGNRYISSGLILPGSLTLKGERVKNYSAWWSRNTLRWLYSEVEYV